MIAVSSPKTAKQSIATGHASTTWAQRDAFFENPDSTSGTIVWQTGLNCMISTAVHSLAPGQFSQRPEPLGNWIGLVLWSDFRE